MKQTYKAPSMEKLGSFEELTMAATNLRRQDSNFTAQNIGTGIVNVTS